MPGSGTPARANRAYRTGMGIATLTAFLTLWTTVVRDDGNGGGFFLLVMAAGIGAFAAWFEAAGMARAMVGTAIMHMTVGLGIATAPVVASVPGASFKFILSSGFFMMLWLAAAACFHAAAAARRATITAD